MNGNNGQVSALSIVALILSLLGITSLIGVALGIADIMRKDGRNHVCSIIAIVIGSVFSIVILIRIILLLVIMANVVY